MKITNIEKGPRGVNAVSGPVLIEPGATVDIDLSDEEIKVAKATGWFDIDRSEPVQEDPDAAVRAELGARADAVKLKPDRRWSIERLREEVEKAEAVAKAS